MGDRVKTESKCCALMGNGKNIQLIKYCQQVKTIVFLMDHEAGIKSVDGKNGVGLMTMELFLKNHCWTRYGKPISDVRSVAIDTKTNFG
jgi:hypothetical protein